MSRTRWPNPLPALAGVSVFSLVLGLLVHRGVQGSGGYFAYASDDAYRTLAIARQLVDGPAWQLGMGEGAAGHGGWTAILASLVALVGPVEALPGLIGIGSAVACVVALTLDWRWCGLPASARAVWAIFAVLAVPIVPAVLAGSEAMLLASIALSWWLCWRRAMEGGLVAKVALAIVGTAGSVVAWELAGLGLVLAVMLGIHRRLALAGLVAASVGLGGAVHLVVRLALGVPIPLETMNAASLAERLIEQPHLPVLALGLIGLPLLQRPTLRQRLGISVGVAAAVLSLVLAPGLHVAATLLALASIVPLLHVAFMRARRRQLTLALLVLVGLLLIRGLGEHRAAVRGMTDTWQISGQIARVVGEGLPGTVAVAPAGWASWRAGPATFGLGCGDSVVARRACADGTWTPEVMEAELSRRGVRYVALHDGWERAPLPTSWSRVASWSGEAGRVVFYDRQRPDGALLDAVRSLDDRLVGLEREGTGGVEAVLLAESAGPDEVFCGSSSEVVWELSGAELVTQGGRINGGGLVSRGTDVYRSPELLRPGQYRLEIWAGATAFDGRPAELEVRLGTPLTTVQVQEGESRRYVADFEIAEASASDVRLTLMNDATAPGRDRNIVLSAARLTRLRGAPVDRRIARLAREVEGANILLISIDTLRADHLGGYGYERATSPSLDALADAGVRFDNAISASHWTAPSHTTLLTGLHPNQHGVVSFPEPERLGAGIVTLAERLAEAGWSTGGFSAGLYVSETIGLAQGFQQWEERVEEAQVRFRSVGDWIEGLDGGQRFFAFVHTYQVHEPYDPPAPYDRLFDADFVEDPERILRKPLAETWLTGWRPTPEELAFQIALYDGEIRYTDTQIGALLERLERLGRLKNTLVVVTSDHGEEFFEHGAMGHGQLQAEQLRVPLIMAHPALERSAEPVVEQIAGAVDVMPTLLELVGVEWPDGLAGRSLVPAMAGRCDPDAAAFSSSEMFAPARVSVFDGQGHWLRDRDRERFYRVLTDRAERYDVAGDAQDEVEAYRSRSEDWLRGLVPMAEPEAASWSDEEREGLRALGYVGD